MNQFSFSIPQNIILGMDCFKQLPKLLDKLASKHTFIISGPHLNKMGVVSQISQLLEDKNIAVTAFTETEANPSIETAETATKYYKDCGATSIIALGGGSPMDLAKAVGILAKYGGTITDYEGAHKVPGKIVPLIAIPTTAGTGSEVTAFSVITDHSRNYKLTIFSYELLPTYALLDPSFIMSLPQSVAAATSMDAFIHALEAYLSLDASPFSDAMAEKAMELMGKNIRAFVGNRQNKEAACAMMSGSMFAGIAFSFARLGNVHAMAHPLGGFFNIAHGVANAILLPIVLDFNSLTNTGRYEKIYYFLTGKQVSAFTPDMLVKEIKALTKNLGIPENLSQLGVTADKIPAMAADAMKSGNIAVNPRATTKEDIERLYTIAL